MHLVEQRLPLCESVGSLSSGSRFAFEDLKPKGFVDTSCRIQLKLMGSPRSWGNRAEARPGLPLALPRLVLRSIAASGDRPNRATLRMPFSRASELERA